jgi:phosphatidate cytidylyltransferase
VSRNLIARIAVAIVFIPLILWISYQGGTPFFGMILLFALIAMTEFLRAERIGPSHWQFWLAQAAVVLSMYLHFRAYDDPALPAVMLTLPVVAAFFLLSGAILGMGRQTPQELFTRHTHLVWGVVYIGLLYPQVLHLGLGVGSFNGGDTMLFVFGLLWVGDTAAMGIGSWLGKRKLAPTVSPNKTVAGFTGGITGALAIGIVMYAWKFNFVPVHHVLLIAVGASVFGQLGDLVESMWKRSIGIKDSSHLIPGHGGMLDRFDSLLFAAPFVHAYLWWLTRG